MECVPPSAAENSAARSLFRPSAKIAPPTAATSTPRVSSRTKCSGPIFPSTTVYKPSGRFARRSKARSSKTAPPAGAVSSRHPSMAPRSRRAPHCTHSMAAGNPGGPFFNVNGYAHIQLISIFAAGSHAVPFSNRPLAEASCEIHPAAHEWTLSPAPSECRCQRAPLATVGGSLRWSLAPHRSLGARIIQSRAPHPVRGRQW